MDISLLNVATSGIAAQQARVDAASHNLANAQTPGFRAMRPELVDLPADPDVYGNPATSGLVSANDPTQGVSVAAINRPDVAGPALATGSPMDAYLPKGVYLAVQLPSGQLVYTRDGNLSLAADGQIQVGMYRLAGNPTVPAGTTSVAVDSAGQVVANGPKGATAVGPLPLTVVPQPEQLEALGHGLFATTPGSGTPRAATPADLNGFIPGAIEGSNVQLDSELTQLIRAQRVYSANVQMIHTWDQLNGDAIQELSRP